MGSIGGVLGSLSAFGGSPDRVLGSLNGVFGTLNVFLGPFNVFWGSLDEILGSFNIFWGFFWNSEPLGTFFWGPLQCFEVTGCISGVPHCDFRSLGGLWVFLVFWGGGVPQWTSRFPLRILELLDGFWGPTVGSGVF